MKRLLLIAVLLFPILLLAYWVFRGAGFFNMVSNQSLETRVQDRVQQFSPLVRPRLQPAFDAAHVVYPPARLILVGLKWEKILEIYASGPGQPLQFVRSYPILADSGGAGPKLREGDLQVPEGIYNIESLNPHSKYHLALRIGYPNAFDREHAKAEGRTNLGGDIMIHGGEVSVGCLAMGDKAIEDIFILAAETGITNITVILSPVDFRKGLVRPLSSEFPQWTESLYATIRSNLNQLPPPVK